MVLIALPTVNCRLSFAYYYIYVNRQNAIFEL